MRTLTILAALGLTLAQVGTLSACGCEIACNRSEESRSHPDARSVLSNDDCCPGETSKPECGCSPLSADADRAAAIPAQTSNPAAAATAIGDLPGLQGPDAPSPAPIPGRITPFRGPPIYLAHSAFRL